MGETTRYATILDTPNEIGWFRFLAGYQALHLEARTGMKMTRGFSAVRFFAAYGLKSKRLKSLLEEVEVYVRDKAAAGEIPEVVFAALKRSHPDYGKTTTGVN